MQGVLQYVAEDILKYNTEKNDFKFYFAFKDSTNIGLPSIPKNVKK